MTDLVFTVLKALLPLPTIREDEVVPLAGKMLGGNLWLMGGYGFAGGSDGFLNDLWMYNISANKWAWIGGDNRINQTGIYGTKGVAPSFNKQGALLMRTMLVGIRINVCFNCPCVDYVLLNYDNSLDEI